jgi:hypothetical protein
MSALRLRHISKDFGDPPSAARRSRLIFGLALPACLAAGLGWNMPSARADGESTAVPAATGEPTAEAPPAATDENPEVAANLQRDEERPRDARRDDDRRGPEAAPESRRPRGPGFRGPRGFGPPGRPGFGGPRRGPGESASRDDDANRRPRPSWGGPRGDGRPPFAGGRRPGDRFPSDGRRGPGRPGPREFARLDDRGPPGAPRFHRSHRPYESDGRRPEGRPWGGRPGFGPPAGFGGGPDSREVVRLLQELRDEVARLNREIQQLRAERGSGAPRDGERPGAFRGESRREFRGFPGGGPRERMRDMRAEGRGRDGDSSDRPRFRGPPSDRRGSDGPAAERRRPEGPPADRRPEGRRSDDRGPGDRGPGERAPERRGSEGRPERATLDGPARRDEQVVEQPRAAEPAAEPAKADSAQAVPAQ